MSDTLADSINVTPIPAFRDNYLWLIEIGNQKAYVVDPGDAEPVMAALNAEQLTLAGILITHHHPDHIGGLKTLIDTYGGDAQPLPVYGPATIDGVTHGVVEGDLVSLGMHKLQVLALPGHTLDHLAYFLPAQGERPPLLFCGDTLFAGGCGRLFEGSPAQMHASLAKLTALPDTTLVYCAHEYTLANLKFAQAVEPNNPDLLARIDTETTKRAHNIPTIPTNIGLEKATNPFLRCAQPSVKHSIATKVGHSLEDDENVFAELRKWKDNF